MIETAKLNALRLQMAQCEQARFHSVLQHGELVWQRFQELVHLMESGNPRLYPFKQPDWLWLYRDELLDHLLPVHTMERYMVYHDCGKPYCRAVDDQGKVHFPNHEVISARTWLDLGGAADEAELMLHDMHMHTMAADEVPEFIRLKGAPTLMLSSLAEVHANAELFGGMSTVSFQAKWKHIDRRGTLACKLLWGSR